jgi:hypothetical protein
MDVEEIKSWCDECCAGRWSYESTDWAPIQLGTLTVPVFCFYFTHRADVSMFAKAYDLEMKLALEVLHV